MTSHRRYSRPLRFLGAAVVACGLGLLHTGTAAATEPLTIEPVFGSPSELPRKPYPPLDFPELVTQPGQSSSTITGMSVGDTELDQRARSVERTGGVGADLLGSKPLGGNAYGGTTADIIPHPHSTPDTHMAA